jgi:PRTRC genetic system protein F
MPKTTNRKAVPGKAVPHPRGNRPAARRGSHERTGPVRARNAKLQGSGQLRSRSPHRHHERDGQASDHRRAPVLALVPGASAPVNAPVNRGQSVNSGVDTASVEAVPKPAFKTGDALRLAPQRALGLPRFHRDVPLRLARGDAGAHTLVNLAEALLEEKVLRSADWKGDLPQTVEAGLNRWLNVEMGAENLKRYIASFEYSDNIEGCDNWSALWRRDSVEAASSTRHRPIGVFALDHDPYAPLPCIKVGRKVLELERTVGKGVGYHLLALAEYATQLIAESITPKWAYWNCEEQYSINGEHESEECGLLTPKQFEAAIPKAAFSTKFNPSVLEKALQFGKFTREQGNLLLEAQRLHRIIRKGKRLEARRDWDECRPCGLDAENVIPMAISWEEDDPVVRVGDDYLDMLGQGGDATSIVWFVAFFTDNVKMIRIGIARLRLMLEAMVCLDGILDALNSDQRLIDILHDHNDPAVVAARDVQHLVPEEVRVRLAA